MEQLPAPCSPAGRPRWPSEPPWSPRAHRKREERLRKVLRARERAEQMREEKIKQMEQKIAPRGKNEKVRALGWWPSGCQWAVPCRGPRRSNLVA